MNMIEFFSNIWLDVHADGGEKEKERKKEIQIDR